MSNKKKAWHSTKSGMVRGIYTNSGMPHQDPKRVRRTKSKFEEYQPKIRITIDPGAVGLAFLSIISIPTVWYWKILVAIAFLVQGLDLEEEEE